MYKIWSWHRSSALGALCGLPSKLEMHPKWDEWNETSPLGQEETGTKKETSNKIYGKD